MKSVTRQYSIKVHAPIQRVFNYVANLTTHPEWSGGKLRIEPLATSGPGVGGEYQSVGDLPMQKDRRNTLRVTKAQPPHAFSFIARDPDFGDVQHDFTFAEQADGVLVTRTITTAMSPAMALISTLLIEPLISGPMSRNALARLKSRLETQQ